jgi:hypothetical protein
MKTQYKNIRRSAFMAQTAIYQGEYRKERNALFKTRSWHIDRELFEKLLNDCRDNFRRRVSLLWGKFCDRYFLPEFLTSFDSGGMAEYRENHLMFAQ